jgi:predicted kinase
VNKRRLVITVGLPRSGKTTWARAQGLPIVNPDSIRLALHGQRFVSLAEAFVWAIAHLMVRALFLAGCDAVIVDATNVTQKRRDEWVRLASEVGAEYVAHVIETSPKECAARALERDDLEILPVIDRMAAEWDLPAPWRGATP